MSLHRSLLALLVALLLVTGGQPPVQAVGTASISGVVTEDGGGGPLEGVAVSANVYDPETEWWESVAYADTSAEGTYQLQVSPGTYRVCFQDYSGGHVPECYDDMPSVDLATPLTAEAGTPVTEIDAELAPGARITGTVRGPSAEPLDGIAVAVYAQFDDDGYDYWSSVGWAQTEADGSYDVGGLVAGTYKVCFDDYSGVLLRECWNDKPDAEQGDPVVVAAGGVRPGVDATLARAGHITGTVTGPSAEPLAGIDVAVHAPYEEDGHTYWEWVSTGETTADGSYDVGGLATGTYKVCFYSGRFVDECWNDKPDADQGDPVAVTAGGTTPAINATLVLGGRITGKVTGAGGEALAEVGVQAYIRFEWEGETYWDSVAWTVTESDGAYELDGLRGGSYRVCYDDYGGTHASECWEDKISVGNADTVPVSVGGLVSMDARLAPGGSISGRVTSMPGLAHQEAWIDVYTASPHGWDYMGWDYAYPSSGGSYRVDGLPAGSYRVCFAGIRSGGYDNECWNDKADRDHADPVTMAVGQARSGIDAVLGNLSSDGYANVSLPTVLGTPQVGQALTATNGTWQPGAAAVYSYQWLAGGTVIAGAVAQTYTPTAADVGRTIQVRVVATGPEGTGSAMSAPTAPVAAAPVVQPPPIVAPPVAPGPAPLVIKNLSRPKITGQAKVGKVLKASKGSWSPAGLTFRHQWYAGTKKIKKATKARLRLTKAHRGQKISVRVTARIPGATSVTVRSRPTVKVRA